MKKTAFFFLVTATLFICFRWQPNLIGVIYYQNELVAIFNKAEENNSQNVQFFHLTQAKENFLITKFRTRFHNLIYIFNQSSKNVFLSDLDPFPFYNGSADYFNCKDKIVNIDFKSMTLTCVDHLVATVFFNYEARILKNNVLDLQLENQLSYYSRTCQTVRGQVYCVTDLSLVRFKKLINPLYEQIIFCKLEDHTDEFEKIKNFMLTNLSTMSDRFLFRAEICFQNSTHLVSLVPLVKSIRLLNKKHLQAQIDGNSND